MMTRALAAVPGDEIRMYATSFDPRKSRANILDNKDNNFYQYYDLKSIIKSIGGRCHIMLKTRQRY